MNTTSKIESILNSLPKMGLTDRFFFLINALYEDYFDSYNEYFNGLNDNDLKHWEESNYLYNKFLETFGDSKFRLFILSEINKLTEIFRLKYSFQLSFLVNPYCNKAYYFSSDSEFALLAPFFFDEASFKAVIIHELSISEVDERKYLLHKYQALMSEIKYRTNSSFVWDANLELTRVKITDGVIFPERSVMNLDNISTFLLELEEKPLDQSSIDFSENVKEDERLELEVVHPQKMIQLFAKVLNRNNEEQQIKNFVGVTFCYNYRKYLFNNELTSDVLDIQNTQNTTLICQTIVLMMKFNYVKDEPASFITRVLIEALRRDNKNNRVWLSDDLRKKISEWRAMSKTDLAKAIGFASEMKLKLFLFSSN